MAELRTEEEQVEALKSWWSENGKSVVFAIILGLGGVFGWKAWQQQQHDAAEGASIAYQNLLDSVVLVFSPAAKDEDLATSRHLADQLKSDHAGTEYARFAALLMAKVAAERKEFDQALAELNWVLANDANAEMQNVAKLRKARIMMAQEEYKKALSVLAEVTEASFQVSALELKGDILLASGDKSAARNAYKQALELSSTPASHPLLKIKLEDLAASS